MDGWKDGWVSGWVMDEWSIMWYDRGKHGCCGSIEKKEPYKIGDA